MKRVFLLVILSMVFAPFVMAGEDSPAVVTLNDEKSFRVFLMSTDGETVATEFQRLRTRKTYEVDEIAMIEFTPEGLNEIEVERLIERAHKLFQQAEYDQLIEEVEPVTAPYGAYMYINNNLQNTYGLLMQAYARAGQQEQAAVVAANLMSTQDELLRLNAFVYSALTAAEKKEIDTAKELLEQIDDPAAALYVQASIERAEGKPRDAIQSAATIVAEHVNNQEWLPRAELLCIELYLETGRTNSALVAARQTAKIYAGTNIGNEADALYAKIEPLMNKSE